MARRRFISTEMGLDERLEELLSRNGWFALLLYTWMIPHANAAGEIDGSAKVILGRVMPVFRCQPQEAEAALAAMDELGLVSWNGKQVVIPREALVVPHTDPRRPSSSTWEALRKKVFARDSYTCQYCGNTTELECDHIVPVSRGGTHAIDNLTAACRKCNRTKSAMTVEEWLGGGTRISQAVRH